LLSQGVPMLLGGDELGRTQRGNNNGWCQDSELSWFDWDHADGRLAARWFSKTAPAWGPWLAFRATCPSGITSSDRIAPNSY